MIWNDWCGLRNKLGSSCCRVVPLNTLVWLCAINALFNGLYWFQVLHEHITGLWGRNKNLSSLCSGERLKKKKAHHVTSGQSVGLFPCCVSRLGTGLHFFTWGLFFYTVSQIYISSLLSSEIQFSKHLSKRNGRAENEPEECVTLVTFLSLRLRVRMGSSSLWRD